MKKSIFNKELFHSTIAIFRYFPKAIVTPQLDGMLFYTPEKQEEFRRRVESLQPDSARAWGTMSPAQMIHHLNLAVGGALGYFQLYDESYWLSRTFFKWILVDFYPFQPRGLRMPLNFIIPHDAQFDFDYEKGLLLEILQKAGNIVMDDQWGPHPMFGKMTRKQWGKLVIIHVDYHLRQFNA